MDEESQATGLVDMLEVVSWARTAEEAKCFKTAYKKQHASHRAFVVAIPQEEMREL